MIKKTNSPLNKKLVIGTAQFMKDYGVIKKSNENKSKLLNITSDNGFNFFDTSDLYEKSYNYIEKNKNNLNLIIKISTLQNNNVITLKKFQKKILKIYSNIKKNKIYGFMIHDYTTKVDSEIESHCNYLMNFCKKKKIKFGFSLYDIQEFKGVKKKYKFNILQVPINVFNREFLIPNFKKFVKQKKIEVHARSIFLQGLLINEMKFIPTKFSRYKKYLKSWHNFCKRKKISKVEACINFINNQSIVKKIVIGFKDSQEFLDILNTNINKKIVLHKKFDEVPKNLKSPNLWKNI